MSRLVTPPLPTHWRSADLGAVCTINPRIRPEEVPSPDTEVTFVPMSAIDEIEGRIVRPELRKYRDVSKGFTPFRDGDVLFAKITPSMENGKAAIAQDLHNGIGFGSTEFHVLRPSEVVLPQWIFAFIRQNTFRNAAKQNFIGSAGQQRVPVDFLERFQVPLPPLTEQERIVVTLQQADTLYRQHRELSEQTKYFVPSLFYELFLKESLAQHWGSIKLGKIAPFVTSGSRWWAKYYASAGAKFIRVQNVVEDGIDLTDLAFVQPPNDPDKERSAILPGDLLITITGTVGRVAVAPADLGEAYVSQHVAIARLNGSIDPYYVAAFLNHPLGGQRQIARQNYGQTKPGLNLDQIQSLVIPAPPSDLISYFVQLTHLLHSTALERLYAEIDWNDFFQALNADAFTGFLTSRWREIRAIELSQLAHKRDEYLQQAGVFRRALAEKPTAALTVNALHPRYHILRELSPAQLATYQVVLQHEGYFTAQMLAEAYDLDLELTRRGLSLLALLGLVKPFDVPVNPSGTNMFYISAYRALQSDDDNRLQDLELLEAVSR